MPPDGERRAIASRAGVVAAGTLASRALGAIRDAVIAGTFAITATDAFVVAFTIPNALRALLGEGAVAAAFVPVLSEARQAKGEAAAKELFRRAFGTMIVILLGVTILGVLFAPWLVTLYAAGYRDDPEKFATTVHLTRVLFPYIFLMGLAALCTGALNSLKRFFAPAFAPGLLNVALIGAALLLVPAMTAIDQPAIVALAIGALIGGVLQLAAQLPELGRQGLFGAPRLGFHDPYVRKAFRLMVPLLVGLGVYQLNVALSRTFASFLPDGAQSYLYYSQRLVEIPQGVFGFAIASAALPTLSDLRNAGRHDELKETFAYALRLSLFVGVPSAVMLFVLAEPICTVLLGRGPFSPEDVDATAAALRAQAIGVLAVASVRATVPMFYAHNDTRSPVWGGVANLALFVAASLMLMAPLGHEGIALANSIGAFAQIAILVWLLRRRVGRLGLREVATALGKIVLASAGAGAAGWAVASFGEFRGDGNVPSAIVATVGAVVLSAAVYLVIARMLGSAEVDTILGAARRRMGRR